MDTLFLTEALQRTKKKQERNRTVELLERLVWEVYVDSRQ